MGSDQNEARRRRKVDAPKLSTKHPIAAIEKRVIDSEAFAALPPSAVVVLLLLARNLDKGKNGHVFLSQEDAGRHGIEKKTLYKQLKALTASGFIIPTTRGGHGKCARYALTWLPLTKDTKGLHVESFRTCAYLVHETELIAWKNRRGKMSPRWGQKSPQPPKLGDKNPLSLVEKNPPVECNTNTRLERGSATTTARSLRAEDWIPGYLARLAAAELTGKQCFMFPVGRTLQ